MSSPLHHKAVMEDAVVAANPERKGIKKGLYLIPTAFTAANVLMGFLSLMSTMRGFQILGMGSPESFIKASLEFERSSIYIGWAFLFDWLDGRVARMTKTTTEIGVQFDSIADVLTFGIAPAFLAYSWGYGTSFLGNTSLHSVGLFVSFMYLMCGAFRLARYNVQASRPRLLTEGTVKVDKKNFVGLPIPPAAGLIAATVYFAPVPLITYGVDKAQWLSIFLMFGVGILGLLMVSTLRYSSFKTVGTGRNNIRLILLLAAVAMLIWLYSKYVLLAITVLYVAHGLVLKVFGFLFNRSSE